MTTNEHQMTTKELEEILKTLQGIIERTPHEEEARAMRGSYGVHLYYLRQRDPTLAQGYTRWMVEHVKRYEPVTTTRFEVRR